MGLVVLNANISDAPDGATCHAPVAACRGETRDALLILVVDDNRGFGMALRNIVGDWAGVRVLALAQDGPTALARAALDRPDLVLMDIAMPGMDGLDVARRMCTWPQPPRIVLMSLNDGTAYRAAAAALGDVGFVGKGDILIELAPLVARMVADKGPGTGSQDRLQGPDGLHGECRAAV